MAVETMTTTISKELPNGNCHSSKPVQTTLRYHPQLSNPEFFDTFYPGTASAFKLKREAHDVVINDMRGREDSFNLDVHGFQLVNYTSSEKDFDDVERVKEVAYPEVAELVKNVTGATHVHVVSHVNRHKSWDAAVRKASATTDSKEPINMPAPAMFVHIDQSYPGAFNFLSKNYPSLDDFSFSRFAIINVWHPVHNTVALDPLAVCDARSVPESDLIGVHAVLPKKEKMDDHYLAAVSKSQNFESWAVKHSEGHKWWWPRGMTTDEALLIKCFDSKETPGHARRSPHTAFMVPELESEREKLPARESVECRCLVFWE